MFRFLYSLVSALIKPDNVHVDEKLKNSVLKRWRKLHTKMEWVIWLLKSKSKSISMLLISTWYIEVNHVRMCVWIELRKNQFHYVLILISASHGCGTKLIGRFHHHIHHIVQFNVLRWNERLNLSINFKILWKRWRRRKISERGSH